MATLTSGRTMAASVVLFVVLCGPPSAVAQGPGASSQSERPLEVGDARLDRPTLTALGVQLLFEGDSDQNASVGMRFREAGASSWRDAQPLHRVRPRLVRGLDVDLQFAGSIFDLRPDTTYEIELRPVDPDGPALPVVTLSGTTRPVPPSDPEHPRLVAVSDAGTLRAALATARPGDVISLAEGTYKGNFAIHESGTETNPIVIRGESRDGVILDGLSCPRRCDVIEIYGSYVHLERMTLQNADHAIDYPITGVIGNVVRRVHTRNTRMGILARAGQFDSYICDNVLEGRLRWPQVNRDDGGAHGDDDGIQVHGAGHVVCHNELSGFGDALKIRGNGARAIDFYGNEVLFSYDNGLELDGSAGNTRALRNRFTNNFMPLSFQPIYGGPAYAIRNVAVNIVRNQFKFHGLATRPPRYPSGMILWHNSFVSSEMHAIFMATPATSLFFTLQNNIFMGPRRPRRGRTVSWEAPINSATIDYNGYFPDGDFVWYLITGRVFYSDFADMQADGMELNGVLLDADTLASGLIGLRDYREKLEPQDVTLATGSGAIDRAAVLANINDDFVGAAPDLGALELGCSLPIYGVRPEGVDETNQSHACNDAPRLREDRRP